MDDSPRIAGPAPRIVVSGASGLVGRALRAALEGRGARVVALSRRPRGRDAIGWSVEDGIADPAALEGVDAVVHLAGEPIAQRWTDEAKRRIRDSRVRGTRVLAEALARAARRPRALVASSGIGHYGSRGDEVLTDDAPPGNDFLADVARAWEAAATPAAEAGIRVVHLRTAMVLDGRGGALPRIARLFRLGLGGPLGGGRQWMSWILLEDLVRAILHALDRDGLAGALNATAPAPVRNADFTRALARALGRPAFVPAPAFALRLVLGREFADALLLASQRAVPERLLADGFAFRAARIEDGLALALAPAERAR